MPDRWRGPYTLRPFGGMMMPGMPVKAPKAPRREAKGEEGWVSYNPPLKGKALEEWKRRFADLRKALKPYFDRAGIRRLRDLLEEV